MKRCSTELDSRRAAAAAAALRADLLAGIETAAWQPRGRRRPGRPASPACAPASRICGADPAEAGRQTALVLAADELAGRFNEVSSAIADARQQAQDTVVTEVARINAGAARHRQPDRPHPRADRPDRRRRRARGPARRGDLRRCRESIEVRALKRDDGGIVLVARNGLVLPLDDRPGRAAPPPMRRSPRPPSMAAAARFPAVTLVGVDVTRRCSAGGSPKRSRCATRRCRATRRRRTSPPRTSPRGSTRRASRCSPMPPAPCPT